MFYKKELDYKYDERVKEWNAIEELVTVYKKQFEDEAFKKESNDAALELLERFNPLLKKYCVLLTSGNINWNDIESRYFICMFIDDKQVRKACKKYYQKSSCRHIVLEKFNFVKECFCTIDKEDVMSDLQSILLIMAKRYKQVGRNFCSYVYNCYRYEVGRYVKKKLADPINLSYKLILFDDMNKIVRNDDSYQDVVFDEGCSTDSPDMSWITGKTCSDIFSCISPMDRQILVKYYLEEWKDKQIAEEYGMHINTVNQRRRNAAKKIAEATGMDVACIKRTRKSGKKAVLPNNSL